MKILGLCLAFLLGPPGGGAIAIQQSAATPQVSTLTATQAPAPAGLQLQLPSPSEIPAVQDQSAGSLALNLGLTGFLILLSFYFYRISVELGREAMRRERLARRFVKRGNKVSATLPPVQGCDVDQVDSLLLPEPMLTAS